MIEIPPRLTTALADRYRIERGLGQGGMATVYLAEDLKHKRHVALKVLKPELAAVLGAERFVQEITTTAALQHPHILPLFDSGEAGGFLYYVMPFIDGETLRGKLDRESQLGIEESVRIACDVASALHYAHQHGVIHRDIKPENILLHDGRPMVADFGIALALSAAAGGRMTETGLSLGTPHYMSPEQATAAKEITARSDVYSLGSVLYEMLAGTPPHTGATAQAIIMKIIAESADAVVQHRKSVPPNVAAALACAIEKVPADRFATAKEFADALTNPGFTTATYLDGTGGRHAPGVKPRTTIALGTIAGLSLLVAAWALTRPAVDPPVSRFVVKLEERRILAYGGRNEGPRLALTPDGRELVYVADSVAGGAETRRVLAVRSFDHFGVRLLPGTEDASGPAVSWDGTLVAYGSNSNLSIHVVSLSGGPPLRVADGSNTWPTWGPEGFVYFIADSGVLKRVSGGGGPIEEVRRLPDPGAGMEYDWLRILPGGEVALVAVAPLARQDDPRFSMHAVDLRTGRVSPSVPGIGGEYLAEERSLVYVTRDGTVMAVPFDPKSLELTGRPQALFGGVGVRTGPTELVVAGGTMAFAEPGLNSAEQMVWVRRTDGAQELVDPTFLNPELEAFALAPNNSRVAVTVVDPADGRSEVWIKQLPQGPLSRLTRGGVGSGRPAWSHDEGFVSFVSRRTGSASLWKKRADGVGQEELVVDIGRDFQEARWSRDGAWMVASVAGPPSLDIVAMRIGTDSVPQPLLAEPFAELLPALSPDGRWLAYVSDETGRFEVFVRPFPLVQEGLWQISTDGAQDPVWSEDSRELFFRSLDGQVVLVADLSGGPASATRRELVRSTADNAFEVNGWDRMFEVSADGQRFLLVQQGTGDETGDLVIVMNFTTELRAALRSRPQ